MINSAFLNRIARPERVQSANRSAIVMLSQHDQQQCLLLHKGSVRFADNDETAPLTTANAPFIFGHGQAQAGQALHLEALTPIAYEILSLDEFYQQVDAHDRWQELLDFMLHLPNLTAHQRALKNEVRTPSLLSQLDSLMFMNAA